MAARTLPGLAVRDVVRIQDGVGLLLDVPAVSFRAGPREMMQRYADMTVAHPPDNSDVGSIVHRSKREKCKSRGKEWAVGHDVLAAATERLTAHMRHSQGACQLLK